MDAFWEKIKPYLDFVEPWMIQAFAIILVFAVANVVQKRVLKRLHTRLSATERIWDDALLEALKKPLSVFLWIIAITLAIDVINVEARAPVFDLVAPARQVGVVACLIWFAIRLVYNVEARYVSKRQINDSADLTSVYAIGKLVRLALIITGALIILQTLGISISGALAFGGVGGLAVGFAARDMLANFFGAFAVYLDRPFEVGNWIRSPDREIEGFVEDIGWRLTRIRTFEKRLLYVPNSVFSNIIVENPSRMSHRRIFETIGVRYGDVEQLPKIIERVRDMLNNHEGIDQRQLIMVYFNSFGGSSLDFFIYCFTRTVVWAEYHAVKEEVLLKISDIIGEHDAEVAFPTRTLHVADAIHLAREENIAESRAG